MALSHEHALLDVAPTTVRSSDVVQRVLTALPALCFVHCVGSMGLALALPTAASLWSSSDWLEGPLWLVSMIVVAVSLLRRGMMRGGMGALFVLSLAMGGLGFLKDVEAAKRVSLLTLIGIQVLSWRLQRRLVAAPVCACRGHQVDA